jgi:uncharacterized protein YyaL (SSP411 family)
MQSQAKKHTNRLIDETSPYLQQHAHNPVDWYPWGDEAFAKAKAEDKAIMVSIGYSACHWCHVMEHESFEDEETARLMNENFVNIKVDMEERPDVDQIYMQFVQITTGRGGWPMTVFITPEKVPFFGGTYFPPEPRYGMPGFRQILLGVADAWQNRREEIMLSATDILGELRRAEMGGSSGAISPALADAAFQSFDRSFDATNGGFGGAPKFPPSMAMEFLLRYHNREPSGPRDGAQNGRKNGPRRHLRSTGRGISPLFRRRRLAGAAFRKDALRQRPVDPYLPAPLADH